MKNIVNTYKLTPQDRSYLVMPLFHVHGLLAGFLAPLHSGGTVIIPTKFSAHTFWPEYTKYKATWYTAGTLPKLHYVERISSHNPSDSTATSSTLTATDHKVHQKLFISTGRSHFPRSRRQIPCSGARSVCHDRSSTSNDIQPTSTS